jgi:maltodextrin utilization protein YvdJ
MDALNYFFEKRKEFKDSNYQLLDEVSDLLPIVAINDTKMKYNLLGTVNTKTKVFTWAWHLNFHRRNCIKTKQLLIYAINKDIVTLNDAYVKRVLTSSTIENVNGNTMILLVALSLYLTKADSMFSTENFKDDVINFYGLYKMD